MSVYMTEEEQLTNIKNWWMRYGGTITLVVSLVLLGFLGFKYWTWHQAKRMQQASVAYEQMMVAFSNQDIKTVRSYAGELIKEYSPLVYADVAHLLLAKIFVAKNKWDEAQRELQVVAKESAMPALKQIAKIRTARIFVQKKSYDNALKELEVVDDSTYLPVINELKGDIYQPMGENKKAVGFYSLALESIKSNGMNNAFLEWKIGQMADTK